MNTIIPPAKDPKEANDTIYKVIGACMEVHKAIGPGFPAAFYQKGMEVEMKEKELSFEPDKVLQVKYKDIVVGEYTIDFLVAGSVVLEVRANRDEMGDLDIQNVLRSLTLSGAPMGLLVNFGNLKIQYKRILPSRAMRGETQPPRLDRPLRPMGYRESGRTRESNPIL
jgi:GxxExxY protein